MARYMNIHVPTLRRVLTGADKIPADLVEMAPIQAAVIFGPDRRYMANGYREGVFTARIVPQHDTVHRKPSGHRIQVKCPTCGVWVPAGRLHQHEGSGRCTIIRDALPTV